jgi:hypothetical protein
MDRFKQYLQQHADELGDDEPQQKLWNDINKRLAADRRPPVVYRMFRLTVAASILGLMAVSGVYFFYNRTTKLGPPVALKAVVTKDTVFRKVEPEKIIEKPIIAVAETPVFKKAKPTIKPTETIVTKNEEDEAIASVEKSFVTLISLQKDKVSRTPVFAEDPGYFNDFYQQLHQLEEDEKTIRKDISKNGLTNDLLTQLITIYKQKLSVLEKLQTEINKTNTHYKQNKEPNSVQKNYFLHL